MPSKLFHDIPLILLCMTLGALAYSWVGAYDPYTWRLEVAPVVVALPILVLTYGRFRFTNMVYGLIFLHCLALIIGGHYTYARVPLFTDISNWLGYTRNSYDGVGHFAQGFVPAMIGRELLIRTSSLQRGKWMAALLILSCLGISALYEVAECLVAISGGDATSDFLGTQGDPWDTQKDMALAGIGATCALALLSRWHDRCLAVIAQEPHGVGTID